MHFQTLGLTYLTIYDSTMQQQGMSCMDSYWQFITAAKGVTMECYLPLMMFA